MMNSLPRENGLNEEVKDVKPSHALKAEEAFKILRASFEFSQGNPANFQQLIFAEIKALHPEYVFPKEIFDQTLARSIEFNKRFILGAGQRTADTPVYHGTHNVVDSTEGSGPPINEEIIESQTRLQLHGMMRAFNADLSLEKSKDISVGEETLLEFITQRDRHYLIEGRKRRNVSPDGRAGDKYLSHLCDNILEGNDTGVPEFNEVFARLKELIYSRVKSGQWNKSNFSDLFKVVDLYNQKHPDKEAIKLPEQDIEAPQKT